MAVQEQPSVDNTFNMDNANTYKQDAIWLLQQMIAIPSFSKEEDVTATIIDTYLKGKGVHTYRTGNNIYATNKYFDKNKPTILLNSHHDTVKPNPGYTKDPFEPSIEDGKLFGLGSNDAGASLVSLLATFLYFYDKKDLPYNILFLASAEEEISGVDGVELAIAEVVGTPDPVHQLAAS